MYLIIIILILNITLKRTELENQSRKFLKEKDELLFSLKEQERELDYLRSLSSHQSNSREHTNSNSEKVYKNPHNSTKNEKKKKIFEKKKSSEKYFADQKYVEFENKIDNLEKHINDLKLGFNKKENNAQRVVHHNVHDEDKSRDLYNEKNVIIIFYFSKYIF